MRAKNTYFQIVGPIYTNKATVTDGEVDIVKIKEGSNKGLTGYIKDNIFYEVSINDEEVSVTENIYDATELVVKKYYYKKTGKGDFKIRLYQDDLDTIFKTDNNGQ